MTRLKVLERFTTVQGTGRLSGVRQHFVRLAGCSVTDCSIRSICDEPDALNSANGEWLEPSEVALEAWREVRGGGWLHVTGGEPFDQMEAVQQLGIDAAEHKLRTHYQTSGVHAVEMPWDWLTVSPKQTPDDLVQTFGQELVLVDDGVTYDVMRALQRRTRFWFYYLMPIEGGDVAETMKKVHHANRCGMDWGFTDQMHKRWGVR